MVRPSTATNTTSADRHEARRMTRSAQSSGSRSAWIRSREPALIVLPSITVNAGSHGLMHVARQRQRQAAIESGLRPRRAAST